MADAGEETGFRFARTLQLLGPLVELCVQRDDAPVRFLELAVELRKLLLPRVDFVQRAHELLVLELKLADRPLDDFPGERVGDANNRGVGRHRLV